MFTVFNAINGSMLHLACMRIYLVLVAADAVDFFFFLSILLVSVLNIHGCLNTTCIPNVLEGQRINIPQRYLNNDVICSLIYKS